MIPKWGPLDTLGKINYTFFVINASFMLMHVLIKMYPIALLNCLCAFICYLALFTPNNQK